MAAVSREGGERDVSAAVKQLPDLFSPNLSSSRFCPGNQDRPRSSPCSRCRHLPACDETRRTAREFQTAGGCRLVDKAGTGRSTAHSPTCRIVRPAEQCALSG